MKENERERKNDDKAEKKWHKKEKEGRVMKKYS